jgi:hypothetical protein
MTISAVLTQKRRTEQTLSADKVSHASLPVVRSAAAARFTLIRGLWRCAPITTLLPAPVRFVPEIRKGAWNVQFAISAIRSGPAVASPPPTECNRQALAWRDQVAHQRRWPGDDSRTVEQVFAEEPIFL